MWKDPHRQTATASKTIVYTSFGHSTHAPPPECDECKETMQPLSWLCPSCGRVH